ncbi:MAG: lipid-binding SYLF domain-containing protein [Vicinamibacterales bacterium]
MSRHTLVLTCLVLAVTVAVPRAQKKSEEAERVAEATEVFREIMAAEDKAIPKSILGRAEAIAVFPGTKKGALGIGGTRGRGIISTRGPKGWSSPAFFTLTGVSFGLQIGGQETDLVLVVNNKRGVETLTKNQFKLGADASVAAGPVGRDAQAATDLQMRAEILSYSRARGVFAGISINGSTIRQDRDAHERFYGKKLESRQILFEGQGGAPGPVAEWKGVLQKFAQ